MSGRRLSRRPHKGSLGAEARAHFSPAATKLAVYDSLGMPHCRKMKGGSVAQELGDRKQREGKEKAHPIYPL